MSEAAVSYDFEQLEPAEVQPRDAAERLLAQARAEAEQVREQARAEGHAEGRAAGHEQGASEISSATQALGEALRDLQSMRAEAAESVERDAIKLALELAGKILQGTLQARPEQVVELMQGALRRISDRRRITILVNHADLERVRGAIGDLTAQGSGVEFCDVQGDERVAEGGAIVRTAEGEVDASVQTQLERAREVIFSELHDVEQAT